MKATAGNNGSNNSGHHHSINRNNLVSSPNETPMHYPIANVSPGSIGSSSMVSSSNSVDLLNQLKEQMVLKHLRASSAVSPTLEQERSMSLSPPLSPDCGYTSSHSKLDESKIFLEEVKKHIILSELLKSTAPSESGRYVPYPQSISGLNESVLSSKLPTRSSYPTMSNSNNLPSSVANYFLQNNSRLSQKIGRDMYVPDKHSNYPQSNSFSRDITASLLGETADTIRRNTFPQKNPLTPQQQQKNLLLHYNHELQTKQRKAHSHLMSAAFNDLMQRQKMLETRELDFVKIERNC